MSDSVRPHRRQPTRLPGPWDSPGKNTGVGCHFLLQCMKVKSESEVTQLCPTLSDPMDCSLPGSSIHGIFQARVQRGFSKLKLCTVLLESLRAAIFEKYLKTAFLELLALQETDDHILKLRNFSTALTKWQPIPAFLPREFCGWRSLVGYGPQGCKELDMTEVT